MGANNIDEHFRSAPLESNLPVLLGLYSIWNVSFLKYPTRAILPYCQVRHTAVGSSRPAYSSSAVSFQCNQYMNQQACVCVFVSLLFISISVACLPVPCRFQWLRSLLALVKR